MTSVFNFEDTSIPTPGDFPLNGSIGIDDTRAELSDVRAKLRCILRDLPERYSEALPHLRVAQDALNLALTCILVADMPKTWLKREGER